MPDEEKRFNAFMTDIVDTTEEVVADFEQHKQQGLHIHLKKRGVPKTTVEIPNTPAMELLVTFLTRTHEKLDKINESDVKPVTLLKFLMDAQKLLFTDIAKQRVSDRTMDSLENIVAYSMILIFGKDDIAK